MSLLDPELARSVLDRALRRGGDLAELYVERRRDLIEQILPTIVVPESRP